MKPFYVDDTATLYLGDMRDVLPAINVRVDAIVADPPYGETALSWDRWPDGWPSAAAQVSNSMWCFASMRMLLDRRAEFTEWRLSQDIVWEKHNGSGFQRDRFKRVHEYATHWYRGAWGGICHEVPREQGNTRRTGRNKSPKAPDHLGGIRSNHAHQDDGSRLLRSVLRVRSMHGIGALHPTEKPIGILSPLIEYACPPGGTVLDPFAGSGSTAVAARLSSRRSVLVEADERYCEVIAKRLSQDVLPLEAS